MLRLIREYPAIENKIVGKKSLFIGLDYDGTLTPIVGHPEQARLAKGTKSLLADLRDLPKTFVCIISGRSCQDVRRKVGVSRIICAGNHGMEIKGKGLSFSVKDSKKIVKEVSGICRNLNQSLKGIAGVWVENKGLTASVHYRLAESKDAQEARSIVFPMMTSCERLKLARGKKVWEIRPVIDWSKGKAMSHVLDACLKESWRSKSAVVYLGDDQTDEDVFSLLRQDGITALVSRKARQSSSAQFFLTHPGEVVSFLRWLRNLWEDKSAKPQSGG
jgi:trehalose 6-phosphate phosphatase